MEGAETTLGGEERASLFTRGCEAAWILPGSGQCRKGSHGSSNGITCVLPTVTGAALSIFRAQRIQWFTSQAPHECLRNILWRAQEPGRPFLCSKHLLRLWNSAKLAWLAECRKQHGTGQRAGIQVRCPSLPAWPGAVSCSPLLWAPRRVCPQSRSDVVHLELNLGMDNRCLSPPFSARQT